MRKTPLLLLVLISLIPLSGLTQGLKYADTVKCYNLTELRIISRKLIEAKECDTLLKITDAIIKTQDTVIMSLQQAAVKQDDRWIKTSHLVTVCESEKQVLQKDLKKYKRRLTWTKIGWAATSCVLTILIVLALLL